MGAVRAGVAGAWSGKALALVIALAPLGCGSPGPTDAACTPDASAPPAGSFYAPSAAVVAGDFLFVANASFRYVCGSTLYDAASITIVSLADLSVVARIPTSAPSAQFLTVAPGGGAVFAVSSGASTFDGAVVHPAGDGALDRIDVPPPGGPAPAAVAATWLVPPGGAATPLAGYPTRAAIATGDAVALLGSGTDGIAFRVDLSAPGAAPEPIPLFPSANGLNQSVEIRIEAGATHVLGFNDDRYCIFSGADGTLDPAALACADVGERADFLEGPLDLALDAAGANAWVVFSPANAVYRIALGAGAPVFSGEVVPAGVAPNRIVRDGGAPGDRFLVVASGSNAIYVFSPGDAEAALLAALPPGTNPWDLAVDRGPYAPPGGRAFVTGLLTNDVTVLALDTGAISEVLP